MVQLGARPALAPRETEGSDAQANRQATVQKLKARLGPLLSPPSSAALARGGAASSAVDKENAAARGRVTQAAPTAVTAAAAPVNPSSSPAAALPDEDAPLLSPPVSRDAFLSAAVEDGVRTPLNMLIRAPAGVQQQLQRAGLAGDAAASSSWRLLQQHPGGAAAAAYAAGVGVGSPGDGGAVTLNELVKLKAAAEAAAADSAGASEGGDALAAYQRYAERMAGYLAAQLSHADNMKVRRGRGAGSRAASSSQSCPPL